VYLPDGVEVGFSYVSVFVGQFLFQLASHAGVMRITLCKLLIDQGVDASFFESRTIAPCRNPQKSDEKCHG
jgi:hypothetical protein